MNKSLNNSKKNICISVAVILINLILFFVKIYIGLFTGSICIYTDAVNNLADCFTSIIAAFGFYVLSRVKSEKYPFGFGRVEDLSSLIMSVVLIFAGSAFAYSSLERLFYPIPVAYTARYAYLLAGTASVKLLIAFFLKFYVKKNPSQMLNNIKLDSFLDFFISLATVMSFTVSEYSGFALDGVVGIIISVIIITSGLKMLLPAVKNIVGRRDDKLCEKACEFIESNGAKVISVNCHIYGSEKIFTVCLDFNGNISLLADKFKTEFGSELYIVLTEVKK